MPENCSSMPVSSQPLPGARHSRPVAIVTALDEVLRDALVASLLLDGEGLLALRYEVVEDSSGLRRLVVAADGCTRTSWSTSPTPQEWARGLAPWLGAEDPLAPWLGERDARV